MALRLRGVASLGPGNLECPSGLQRETFEASACAESSAKDNHKSAKQDTSQFLVPPAENGLDSFREQASVKLVWHKYFQDPTEWWDDRNSKLHPNSPDFRHTSAKESLWVNHWNTPPWVIDVLSRETSSQTANFDSGTIPKSGCRTGDASGVGLEAPQPRRFSWSSLISQHVKSGQGRQGLRIYADMQESGEKPGIHAFVAALKACSSLQDLETARQIHGELIKRGLESDVYVGTMLIDVYAKCGSLTDARNVFEAMPHRNVVSWTAMILGYAQVQEGEVALQLYARMQQEGVVPNDRAYVGALKACSSLAACEEGSKENGVVVRRRCLEKVKAIHLDVVKHGFDSDLFVGNILLDVYAKCGSLVDARQVFENMPCRNVVTWTAMILGYAQMEQGEEALNLYTRMQEEDVEPNDRTYVSVLKAFSSLAASQEDKKCGGKDAKKLYLEQVRAIHSDLAKRGFESNAFVGNMLVDVYAKCGSLVDARRLFDKMHHRTVVSWTSIILGHAQMEEGEVALQLYARMQQEGTLPNDRTYVAVLKAYSSLATVEEGDNSDGRSVKRRCLDQVKAIHAELVAKNLELNVFVGNMLVDVYAKCGSLADARHVFERLAHRNVVSWNSMILGYAQMEEGEEALRLYARMQQEGVVPDDRTFLGAIKACSSLGDLPKGRDIHSQISGAGIKATHAFVASGLIDMYGKCGSIAEAQQVFDAVPVQDIVMWNALIAGYARQGATEPVFHLLERMKQEGVQPNRVTFLSILNVCNHAGLLDKGQYYFEAMTSIFSITPALEHYTCMIDLLGRAGQVETAMQMAKRMPFQADAVVWDSVLAACQKWQNVELGRQAFQYVVRLDKNDAAAYVLMSNIYAAAHMWEEAEDIQAMRMKAGAWKQPGQSLCTGMDGVVHAFAVGGEHPESQVIHANLGGLVGRMREEGYVPRSGSLSERHT